MGIFDPKVDANISPTQQVDAGPSGLQVASNLFGTALGAFDGLRTAPAKQSAGERSDALDEARLTGVTNGLNKVQALRAQGKDREADTLEKTVVTAAARDGATKLDGFDTIYTNLTGKEANFAGLTVQEQQLLDLRADPAYDLGMAKARKELGPDATPEALDQAAISHVQYNRQTRAQQEFVVANWENGGEATAIAFVSDLGTNGVMQLEDAVDNGFVIDPDTYASLGRDLDQAQAAQVSQLVSQGATQEMINVVDSQYDALKQRMSKLEDLVGNAGIQSKHKAQLIAAVQSSKDLDAQAKIFVVDALEKGDSTNLVNLGINFKDDAALKAIIENTQYEDVEMFSFSTRTDPVFNTGTDVDLNSKESLFDAGALERSKGTENVSSYQKALSFTTASGAFNFEVGVQTPEGRSTVAGVNQQQAANVVATTENGDRLSGAGIAKIFDGTGVKATKAVGRYDPAAGRTMAAQNLYALRGQETLTLEQYQAASGNLPASLDKVDGKYNLTNRTLIDLGADPVVAQRIQSNADEYYDGDMRALMEDKGSRLPINRSRRDNDPNEFRKFTDVLEDIKDVEALEADLGIIRGKITEFDTLKSQFAGASGVATDFSLDILPSIMAGEGGYQNDPNDGANFVGGLNVGTNMGITPRTLAAFRNVPVSSIRAKDMQKLTEKEAGAIYKDMYYDAPKMNLLPSGLQATVTDMGVHAGPATAIKILQRAVGVEADGIMGPETAQAANALTAKEYNTLRKQYYDKLIADGKVHASFANGFTNRLAKFGGIGGSVGPAQLQTEAPAQSEAPEGVDLKDAVQVAGMVADAGQMTRVDAASNVPIAQPEALMEPDAAPLFTAADTGVDDKTAELVSKKLTAKQKRQIRAAGYRPEEAKFFPNQAEAEAALAAGEVERGTLYVTDSGNVYLLE